MSDEPTDLDLIVGHPFKQGAWWDDCVEDINGLPCGFTREEHAGRGGGRVMPPLLTDQDLHEHAHTHAPDDPSVTMPGGQVHLEWHQQRQGGSRDHAHAHVDDDRGVWEHHR